MSGRSRAGTTPRHFFGGCVWGLTRRRSSSGRQAAIYWRLINLRLLFSEQPQQHLVSSLIARRITFADGYELAIPNDIFVMDVAPHRALQRQRQGVALASTVAARSRRNARLLWDAVRRQQWPGAGDRTGREKSVDFSDGKRLEKNA